MKKNLLIANWKMNPRSAEGASLLVKDFKKFAKGMKNVVTVICPPTIYIPIVKKLCSGTIVLGAQDSYYEKEGSHTGETSPLMLANEGVEYVVLGHSERRANGESSQVVAKKSQAALAARIQPIVCIGEEKRDTSGAYLKHIKEQLIESLDGIPKTKLHSVIIAYEPIWAIGAKEAMSAHEMHQMVLYIKKIITQKYSRAIASKISVVYGGSVTSENARDMIENGCVDGLLVGRASLDPKEFAAIAKNISHAKRNF